jgi:protein gp37
MGATSIEWTDHSINPIRAKTRAGASVGHYCEKVSAGCAHCYSSRMQVRFGMPPFGSGQHRDIVEVFLDSSKLAEVMRRKAPTRYFWCDMTDLFGDWVNNEMIDRCFAVMGLTRRHTHQVLTKRVNRMHEYLSDPDTPRRIAQWMAGNAMVPARYEDYVPPWPNPSIWCGVSIEDQATADERIPHLLKTPAAVRFLSCEPLIGPVDLARACPCGYYCDESVGHVDHPFVVTQGQCHGDGIHWVIVGGESGPGARPMHPDWARSIRDECQEAGVSYFFKQWGEWGPVGSHDNKRILMERDGRCSPYDPPLGVARHAREGLATLYRVGKKAAGRLLDGREWNEFPQVAARQGVPS